MNRVNGRGKRGSRTKSGVNHPGTALLKKKAPLEIIRYQLKVPNSIIERVISACASSLVHQWVKILQKELAGFGGED